MLNLIVDINLTEDRWLQFYRRPGQAILARARNGQLVEFPAEHMRAFVTPTGVQGTFKLTVDDENRLQQIERI